MSQYKLDRKLIDYLKSENIYLEKYKTLSSIPRQEAESIKYSTISSFKGLESPVIVLLNIDELNKLSSLFYVGITRATERLVIHIKDQALKEVYEV